MFQTLFPMKYILIAFIAITFISCSKMEEKKTGQENKTGPKNDPSAVQQDKTQSENNSPGKKDEKADNLMKSADETLVKYSADKSEGNKQEVVSSCLAAANYLMFEANLPAREKYRPALKYYRKVLELDPKNEEAIKNKKQIEDIYEQMGMPIPQ